ncbi:hypothetical protein GCM10022251_05480 [Phytohabitans flavus]
MAVVAAAAGSPRVAEAAASPLAVARREGWAVASRGQCYRFSRALSAPISGKIEYGKITSNRIDTDGSRSRD